MHVLLYACTRRDGCRRIKDRKREKRKASWLLDKSFDKASFFESRTSGARQWNSGRLPVDWLSGKKLVLTICKKKIL